MNTGRTDFKQIPERNLHYDILIYTFVLFHRNTTNHPKLLKIHSLNTQNIILGSNRDE